MRVTAVVESLLFAALAGCCGTAASHDAGRTSVTPVDAMSASDASPGEDVVPPADVPVANDASADRPGADASVPMDVVGMPDAMPPTDAGSDVHEARDTAFPADALPAQCRFPLPGRGCYAGMQQGTTITEMRVASAPPVTTAGWYPAGTYVLTAATLYTGAGGAAGPSGAVYAATLEVHGMGSVDFYQGIQTQAGCPDVTYAFNGDTFGGTTSLHDVAWTCPATPSFPTMMAYTGTLTTFTMYFALEGGSTLAQEFTLRSP